jgi:flagellin-specific chaperone FliS
MHDSSDINPYLQQEVMSASKPRLRWLLVKKAEDLCGLISQLWLGDQPDTAEQWIIRVRDILGELLSGVQDSSNPAANSITDFYIFLLQLLSEVQGSRDQSRLRTLRELLSIEAETWRLVAERENSVPATDRVPIAPLDLSSNGGPHSSFSLEV